MTWGFWVMYGVVFSLISIKSFAVPITHDEAWTVLRYLDKSVWDIMMYPDSWPNNHILNTLLAKASAGIFGVHDWSVRLPNLLFFWVFAVGVFRFLKFVCKERMVFFLPAAAIFILSPYFLDFFGLCRGYGISSALTILSVSYFVTGFALQRQKHIWRAIGLALIASYANFTVLVYFAGAFGMTILYFIVNRHNWIDFFKKISLLLVVSLSYVALIYTPIYKMKSTNQFEFWTSKGFYEETIFTVIHSSLTDSSLYTRQEWFAILVVIITLALWVLGVWKVVKSRWNKTVFRHPLVIVGGILFATVFVNLIQTNILGDPNLNGRTALFLLPIFSALTVVGLLLIPSGKKGIAEKILSFVIVLIVVQHLSVSYRADSVKEWRYDKHTLDVLAYLEEKDGQPSLRTDWIFLNSFQFYDKYESSTNWELKDKAIGVKVDADVEVDYYYVLETSIVHLQSNFVVEKIFDGGQVLMRRK